MQNAGSHRAYPFAKRNPPRCLFQPPPTTLPTLPTLPPAPAAADTGAAGAAAAYPAAADADAAAAADAGADAADAADADTAADDVPLPIPWSVWLRRQTAADVRSFSVAALVRKPVGPDQQAAVTVSRVH